MASSTKEATPTGASVPTTVSASVAPAAAPAEPAGARFFFVRHGEGAPNALIDAGKAEGASGDSAARARAVARRVRGRRAPHERGRAREERPRVDVRAAPPVLDNVVVPAAERGVRMREIISST